MSTKQFNLEFSYENEAQAYKEAVQDHRKLAVAESRKRMLFLDSRLAELGEI